jgi:EAL domain-containing protein (putative c-di-GMP-specific phosphodiesterase class I)
VVGYLVKGGSVDGILESIERAAGGQASLSVEVTGDVIDELVEQRALGQRDEERRRRRRERIEHVLEQEDALSMVFQPIYALMDDRIVGAEALARFSGPPRRGPDRWFAEATEVGLRLELELAAVDRALMALPDLPTTAFLAVNASPATAASRAFLKLLTAAGAERIVVEITEHAPIEDYDELNDALSKLRALGVQLAIDDAGAGFASLRHILQLAPDFIKLDRTLIEGIASDRSRQALAVGLISFAEKARATIVAEGIECEEEVAALLTLGVGCGQGYFLARPGPLPLHQPGT